MIPPGTARAAPGGRSFGPAARVGSTGGARFGWRGFGRAPAAHPRSPRCGPRAQSPPARPRAWAPPGASGGAGRPAAAARRRCEPSGAWVAGRARTTSSRHPLGVRRRLRDTLRETLSPSAVCGGSFFRISFSAEYLRAQERRAVHTGRVSLQPWSQPRGGTEQPDRAPQRVHRRAAARARGRGACAAAPRGNAARPNPRHWDPRCSASGRAPDVVGREVLGAFTPLLLQQRSELHLAPETLFFQVLLV